MLKSLWKKVVEETNQEGVKSQVTTLITADKFDDVYNSDDCKDHEKRELIFISKIGDVAIDLCL